MASATDPVSTNADFMPHGMCYLWQKDVLYLHVFSDSLIALAYYSIPLALVYFITRRQGTSYHWMIIMFALFILACGTTHLMDIWTIWNPDYWADGLIKALTALISLATALALWYIMPEALTLPSPKELEIANRRLHSELRERKRYEEELSRTHNKLKQQYRYSLISQMNGRLQMCRVVGEVKPIIYHYLPKLFPDSSGAVYVQNDSRTLIELLVAWGQSPPVQETFEQDQCWALRQGSMHIARDTTSDTDLPCDHYRSESAINCVCLPMIADGNTTGILHLRLAEADTEEEDVEDSMQQLIMTSTAEHIGLAIANLRLREELEILSVRDPLTNLYNRRYLKESFEREISRSQRSGDRVAILILDLDHFKSINDKYGHEAGDAVLREVAGLMQKNVRAEDIVARYGGEEFVIIMPGIDLDNTREKAEILRQDVKSLSIVTMNQELSNLSVSIGITIYPDDSDNTESLLSMADAALYEAKNTGRDRVVSYTDLSSGNGGRSG